MDEYKQPPKMRIALWRNPSMRAFGVHLIATDEHGKKHIMVTDKPLYRSLSMGIDTPPSNFHINDESAQQLMDDLWQGGVRPSNTSNATEMGRHLEDMRAIVFDQLKIEKPKGD